MRPASDGFFPEPEGRFPVPDACFPATGHEQVLAKIGKGGGQVTAAQLQMKRGADPAFKTVGMFTARSYVDHTPLAQAGVPEERQYQLLALKNDVVIGQPSPILSVLVS